MNEGSFILRWARLRLCHLKLFSFLFYPARRIECKHLIVYNAHITTSFKVIVPRWPDRPSRYRFARAKQRLLYATPWPASGLWAKKPIVTPADLAGLPLRVYDSTGFALFAAAGARPANLSFADVMPRIVDGSIEAVLSSGDGGAGRKLWNYLPYFTEIGYAMPLSFGTLSQPLYD